MVSTIYTSITPGLKVAYLFLFMLIGVFISGIFTDILLQIPIFRDGDELAIIYINSINGSIFSIALPAYFAVKLSNKKPLKYLKLKGRKKQVEKMIFAALLFITSYAISSFLAQYNKGMVLPEWLSEVESVMRSMEDSAIELTNLLLSGKTIGSLIINLIVVAGFAAVSEELFFRGALQQFIQEKFKSNHWPVWITALVFSLVHFQFYGFLPRLFLGALLGYLFLCTRNLWAPILFHFLNNATVILLNFFWQDTEWFKNIESAEITTQFVVFAFISLLFTVLLLVSYNKKQNKLLL